MDIPIFSTEQLTLLDDERDAEVTQTATLIAQSAPKTLQRQGIACLNLVVSQLKTGFGGKVIVELVPDPTLPNEATPTIPAHGFRNGDIVRISEMVSGSAKKKIKNEAEQQGVSGVVAKVLDGRIVVALDKDGDDIADGKRLWLVKLSNDVTYKRMLQTITKLKDMPDSNHSKFIKVLFGQLSPSPVEIPSEPIQLCDDSLNESQINAVKFALAAEEIALIHGPPGTGKTHTLIELIRQFVAQGKRILVCGPSNISVDNIAERLAPCRIPFIRVGHPARLLPSVLDNSLDVLTKTSDSGDIIKDVRREMDEKMASVKKTRSGKERRNIWREVGDLRKEFREREKKCIQDLMKGSKVVLATLHGAGGFHVFREVFDVVVIDEASQALEAQCWVPLLTASKCVLAGDHLQLPPTIKSNNIKTTSKLQVTLFDRMLNLYDQGLIKRMLTTQYRMHEKIMRFPSDTLYDAQLLAAESVKARLLTDLDGVAETDDTREPLVFWDTQGGAFMEKNEEDVANAKGDIALALGESKSNEMEVALCHFHVNNLVTAGVQPEDIAVITPYNAQLALLSQALKEKFLGIELGSVDGFQGREKQAVVLSLVRSNSKHEVGFLGEKRRLNVAMTRPKRHLCVIGDSETISKGNGFLSAWMAHLEEHADLRYPDVNDLQFVA